MFSKTVAVKGTILSHDEQLDVIRRDKIVAQHRAYRFLCVWCAGAFLFTCIVLALYWR